jgi:hypothetical protein
MTVLSHQHRIEARQIQSDFTPRHPGHLGIYARIISEMTMARTRSESKLQLVFGVPLSRVKRYAKA